MPKLSTLRLVCIACAALAAFVGLGVAMLATVYLMAGAYALAGLFATLTALAACVMSLAMAQAETLI